AEGVRHRQVEEVPADVPSRRPLPRTALALPVLAPEAAAPGHLPRGFGWSAPREVHPGGCDGRRLSGLSRHPQLGDQRGAFPLLDQRPPALSIARLAARARHATRSGMLRDCFSALRGWRGYVVFGIISRSQAKNDGVSLLRLRSSLSRKRPGGAARRRAGREVPPPDGRPP